LSTVALYTLVQAGDFDETLYYRLNTITIDFTASQNVQG
jgi:transcriptional regulator of acetoin/glycerol metabolism